MKRTGKTAYCNPKLHFLFIFFIIIQKQHENVTLISTIFSKLQLPLTHAEGNKDTHLQKWALLIPTKCWTLHIFLGTVENYNIWILNIVVNICDIKYLTASIKYSTRLGLLDTEQECERERLCLRELDQMWTSTVCECINIGIMDQHL